MNQNRIYEPIRRKIEYCIYMPQDIRYFSGQLKYVIMQGGKNDY